MCEVAYNKDQFHRGYITSFKRNSWSLFIYLLFVYFVVFLGGGAETPPQPIFGLYVPHKPQLQPPLAPQTSKILSFVYLYRSHFSF